MGYKNKQILSQKDKPCECCKKVIKVCSSGFDSWKQYCVSCYGRKGNHEFDIISAGTNQYGYTYYKTVPKKIKEVIGYSFIDD